MRRRWLVVVIGLVSAGVSLLVGERFLLEEWQIRRLASESKLVQADAVRRLGELRSRRAVPHLCETAFLAFAYAGEPARTFLIAALAGSDARSRQVAVLALTRMGEKARVAADALLRVVTEDELFRSWSMFWRSPVEPARPSARWISSAPWVPRRAMLCRL